MEEMEGVVSEEITEKVEVSASPVRGRSRKPGRKKTHKTTSKSASLPIPKEHNEEAQARLPMENLKGPKMQRVKFLNLDPSMAIPETREKFYLELAFKGEDMPQSQRFKLRHDCVYDLPCSLVRHLNGEGIGGQSCAYPKYEVRKSTGEDDLNNVAVDIVGWDKRFICVPQG